MKFFKKPIFSGFNPNMTTADLKVAGAFLLLPWKWSQIVQGLNPKRVEEWFEKYFSVKYAHTFDSGRSALKIALESAGVQEGHDVLVQGYTCVVVSNAITSLGAKPVYVDIDDDLNMSPDELQKKSLTRQRF